MNSTPLKPAIHVLCIATIVVVGLGGLALLAPSPNQVNSQTNSQADQRALTAETQTESHQDTVSQVAISSLPEKPSHETQHRSHDSDAALVTAKPNEVPRSAESRPDPKVKPESISAVHSLESSTWRMLEARCWSLQQQIDRLAAQSPLKVSIEDQNEPKLDLDEPKPPSQSRRERADTAEAKPTTTVNQSSKPQTVVKGELCEGSSDHYKLQLQNADVREALLMLGELTKLNVVLAPSVRGQIAAISLQDVSAEQALSAITKSLGLVAEQSGQLAYVTTADELKLREKGSKESALKIYRPEHISVERLQELIKPLLSKPVYLMTLRAPPTAGDSTRSGTGGVLIVDDPSVISRVDELVNEVDQPAVLATRPDEQSTKATPPHSETPSKPKAKSGMIRKISREAPLPFHPPAAAVELTPLSAEQ